MKSSKIKLSLSNVYYLMLEVVIIISAIQRSVMSYRINQSLLNNVFLCAIIFVFFIGVLKSKSKITRKELIMILVAILSYFFSHSLVCFYIVSICIVAKNCEFEKIVRVCCIGNISAIILVLLADISGAFLETSFMRGDTGEIRYSFGFTHPNTFCVYLIGFIVAYYANKKRCKIIDFFPLIIAAFISINITKSITASLVLLAIFVYLIIARIGLDKLIQGKKIYKMLKTAIPLIVFLVFAVLYIAYRFDSLTILSDLGKTANLRLLYAHQALTEYGVSIAGQEISTYGSSYFLLNPNSTQKYFTIDCLYILLLVRDGALATIIIIGYILESLRKAIKVRWLYFIYVIIVLIIYSIMESGLINCAFAYIYAYGVAKNKEDS